MISPRQRGFGKGAAERIAPARACLAALGVTLVLATASATTMAAGQLRADTGDTGALEGFVRTPWARDDADAIVAVYVQGAEAVPLDPPPVIDQLDLTFVPHVLPLTVGTSVRFRNSDAVLHNVFSPSADVTEFDLGTYPQGAGRTVQFDVPGEVVVLCNVHPNMSAFILVLESPHWAVSDPSGYYRIDGVPAGEHVVWLWSQLGEAFESEVTIVAGQASRGDFAFAKRRRGGWLKRRGEDLAGLEGISKPLGGKDRLAGAGRGIER